MAVADAPSYFDWDAEFWGVIPIEAGLLNSGLAK
jgi:hypothetical protein